MSNVYNYATSVTPSDTVDLSGQEKEHVAIFGNSGGDVVVVFQNGKTETLTFPDSGILPLKVKRINSTNTTATGIKLLYKY